MNWDSCLVSGVATLSCLPILFTNILNVLFMFAGIVAVIFIITAGFRFITSGGDAKQLESARQVLTYAIAGLIIILLSYLLLTIITTVTGVNCVLVFGPLTSAIHGISNCAK